MIQIIKKGVYTSLQTTANNGLRAFGVSPGGAMDIYAHQKINKLINNTPDSAVMEMHFPAPVIKFLMDTEFVLGGADFGAQLGTQPLLNWKVYTANTGNVLRFQKITDGFRSYFTIKKGFGNRLSVYENYLVKDQEILEAGLQELGPVVTGTRNLQEEINSVYEQGRTLYCIEGPDYYLLHSDAKQELEKCEFAVGSNGNRMGFPLESSCILTGNFHAGRLSAPVTMGAVQLLPNGKCIVLMADHNTIGGYPVIATVLEPEFPKLAQLQPGKKFHFKIISPEAAEENYLAFHTKLQPDAIY
jgi:antagonist of KipI